MIQRFFISLRFATLSALMGSLFMAGIAWAYKVEKICENVSATASVPAHKKCKVVRANEGGAPAKGDGKGDGNGKGDGKGAGKGDAKADAKK